MSSVDETWTQSSVSKELMVLVEANLVVQQK
jgi:hypothetical protein